MSAIPSSKPVADAISACRDPDGHLRLDSIVDSARDPNSPLHSFFEWQDGEAARLYRLEQARNLVKAQRIPFYDGGTVLVTSVQYVPVPSEAGTYRQLLDIPPSSDLAKATLRTEMGRLSGQLSRIRKIAKVLALEDELDELLRGMADMVGKAGGSGGSGAS